MKILMLETMTYGDDISLEQFNRLGEVVTYSLSSYEEAVARMKEHNPDVVIINKTNMNAECMAAAPNLKMVAEAATGYNNIDTEYAKAHGIRVANVAGYSTQSVIQHTFALAFYLIEKMRYYDDFVKSGEYAEWPCFSHFANVFHELAGKTWGIVGLGNIGRGVAKIAADFGCNVIYYSASGHSYDVPYERYELDEFLKKYGEFQVIHFNNMEGLSLDVFDLKEEYPNTKFIFSLHNYVPICMTGFYYNRYQHVNCVPECTAEDCDKCIDRSHMRNYANEILERGRVNREGGLEKADEYEWSDKFGFDRLSIKKDAKQFIEFKNRAVEALNKNMDSILAVSQRVLDLAVENHIEKEKLILSYIGTRVAEFQIGHSNCEIGDYFKIGYLGSNLEYEEKGYPFLLDALEEMDSSYAAKIELVLTTTTRDKDAYIQKKLKKFHKVKIIHGYSHADLHNILTGVNLGVIPVLWEDNLPQVAIEMVAFGVPILSSSAGGASELTRSDAFRFNVGDTEDFLKKIYAIVDQEVSLDEFWKNHSGLCTNQEHYEQIEKVYALGKVNNISLSGKEVSEILEEKDFLYQHFVEDDVDVYRKKIERLSTELEEVRKQRDNLGWRLSETRKSKTYKIGRAITAIPRKIREVK